MKRTILFLTLLLSSLGAFAQTFTYDGLNYSVISSVDHTCKVASNRGASGDIIIPETVTYNDVTYSVTSIGEEAFDNCSGLTSVTIPNSVTTIGNYAFDRCRGLTSVTIPNSVTSIGDYAFRFCSGLTSVTIPNSVTSIGYDAFFCCSGLTSVTIPNSVTTIGNYALSGCSGLTSVTIPNSVTSIGENAFAGCSGLTSVTIPNSVTSIGRYAFFDCSGLTSVTIPNSVTSIREGAFFRCSGLTSVTIPNSVTSIEKAAFAYCSGLTSVTIPNSVTSIGGSAFESCSGLRSVTIPNSVTTIGNYAFYGCSRLTSVTIPNSVSSIGVEAFGGCSGLTSVTIPNLVTTIGSSAFSGCTQLATVYDYSNLPITRGSFDFGEVAQYATKVVKVLTDDRGDFNAPNDYIVDEVTYTRNYDQGNRSTLCLPFKPETVKVNGQPTTDLKFYAFAGFDGSTITFDEVTFANLQANTPYMVEWPESKVAQDFVFGATTNAFIPATGDANSRTVTNGNGKFIGTMERMHMNSTNYYGYKNGYFVQSRGGSEEEAHAHVNPFRAYFEITTPSGSQGFAMPTEIAVQFNTAEDNVGIDSVEAQQSNIRYSNDVYDMMGRMVRKNAENLDGLRKGVYIWKGEKKVVF